MKLRSFGDVKAVLFDLDGTVYQGDELIPGALSLIEYCRLMGKRVVFLTNNSARKGISIVKKLRSLGVECGLDEVLTAGQAAALYTVQRGFADVYVSGTEDLRDEFRAVNIRLTSAKDAKYLFIGYDPGFTYEKCSEAVNAALHAKQCYACNMEKIFRGQGGQLLPGCGAMVAAIEWCASRKVDGLLGKPNTTMLETFALKFNYMPINILVIGDTLESDIAMADAFGCPSFLVGDMSKKEEKSYSMKDVFRYLENLHD